MLTIRTGESYFLAPHRLFIGPLDQRARKTVNVLVFKVTRSLALVLSLAAVAVSVVATAPRAQTDYSLRVRGLGVSFAGLVDDPFTDAFLNPARVGDLLGRHVYAARFPDRSVGFYYPDNDGSGSRGYLFPPEDEPGSMEYGWPRVYTPYTIGFVTPVTGSATLSLALEAAVNGYDNVTRRDEFNTYSYGGGDQTRTVSRPYGSQRNLYHVVADVALGTGTSESTGTRLGARIRFAWERWKRGEVRGETRFYSILPALEEIEMDYSYNAEQGEFETAGGELSVGLFRGSGFVAQAVLGAGGKRETLLNTEYDIGINDEDYDGNGRNNGGSQFPRFSRTKWDYDASRTYDGVSAFGRLGLRWGARVRSFHEVSWERNTGDGAVSYGREFYFSDTDVITRQNTTAFPVDGEADGFVTNHSFGFSGRFGDDVLVAVGARVQYVYERFEEIGTGTGTYNSTEDSVVIDFAAPYRQEATYEKEYWLVSLPAAIEWEFHRSMAWRFGMELRATRLDENGVLVKNVELPAGETFDEVLPFQELDSRVDYATATLLSMGFSFDFHDRVVLDILTAVSASSLNAASVSTAFLKFNF
jgi:hypothetical protein